MNLTNIYESLVIPGEKKNEDYISNLCDPAAYISSEILGLKNLFRIGGWWFFDWDLRDVHHPSKKGRIIDSANQCGHVAYSADSGAPPHGQVVCASKWNHRLIRKKKKGVCILVIHLLVGLSKKTLNPQNQCLAMLVSLSPIKLQKGNDCERYTEAWTLLLLYVFYLLLFASL